MSSSTPQYLRAYVSQYDLHHAEMTVRETINFSSKMLGTNNEFGKTSSCIQCAIHSEHNWNVLRLTAMRQCNARSMYRVFKMYQLFHGTETDTYSCLLGMIITEMLGEAIKRKKGVINKMDQDLDSFIKVV